MIPFLAAAGISSWAAPVDKTLIESAILIHHEELTDPGPLYASSRFRRAQIPDANVTQAIDDANSSGNLPSGFTATIKSLFKGAGQNTNVEIKDGFQAALEYITNQKETFGLDVEQIGKATQSLVQAALEASAERDPDQLAPDPEGLAALLPDVVIKTFIPVEVRIWGEHMPEVTKNLTEGMALGVMAANLPDHSGNTVSYVPPDRETLMRVISEGTITATLEQIRDAEPDPQDSGFYPKIVAVDRNGKSADGDMMLDGPHGKHLHFHPDKTRILEYAANGLAYGALFGAQDAQGPDGNYSSKNVPGLAAEIGSGAAKAAVDFMAGMNVGVSGDVDHSLFTYEVIKSIASGATLGSVLVASSHIPWKNNKIQIGDITLTIPGHVAEHVAYGVASAAMESNLVNTWPGEKADIARIGEAAAFGSSMGAQFATVFDPRVDNYSAWDYELYGQKSSYDRVSLAEATSRGAAQGAIAKAADVQFVDNNTTSRQEILDLARGTAMGAVLSNVAMAIYYETELQSVILASSKGASYGSITAENLHNIEKPRGQTEEFEVEIARAAANGATTGTLFEIVGLLGAKPNIRRADVDSIASAKSATYGSTLGAILGGNEAGQDSIAIKQATEQGSTEGSMDGIALAMGFDEANVGDANIKSQRAIKNAVGIGNTQAATEAAAEMATKSVQPNSSDMLLLMKKYNISPGTTNPAFVFPSPKKKGEEDFLFDEKFPVATPI